MSKIQCKCGHLISNVVHPCPTEAHLIGTVAYEKFERKFVSDVGRFLDAIRNGRRSEWLSERFGDTCPRDLTDSEVISDLLTANQQEHALSVAECEQCGRLWVQSGVGNNQYRSFAPDEGGFGRHFANGDGNAET